MLLQSMPILRSAPHSRRSSVGPASVGGTLDTALKLVGKRSYARGSERTG